MNTNRTDRHNPFAGYRGRTLVVHSLLGSLFGYCLLATGAAATGGFPVGDTGLGVIAGAAVAVAAACVLAWHAMMRRWRERLDAPTLMVLLQVDRPAPLFQLFAAAGIPMLLAGILLSSPGRPHSLVMTGSMFAFVGLSLEWFRRQTRREARVLFTLYAENELDTAARARIDASRAADPAFDAAVAAFQQLNAAVAALGRETGPEPSRA